MPGDMCDYMCACPYMCKTPSRSENLVMPTSVSTIQLHMPNRNFVVATATLGTVTSCLMTMLCAVLS